MWEAICLTLLATAGNNIGKVLQKKGSIVLPPVSFRLKVIRAYAFNKIWVSGFLMDMIGALLMLKALSTAPVSIIQPVSGCGLAILSVFSHFYLKEIMNVLDWVGITLAGFGTIFVGMGGEEQKATAISLFCLPWLVFTVAVLFVVLNGWLHIYRKQRRQQEMMDFEVVEEIIVGLESGIFFGLEVQSSGAPNIYHYLGKNTITNATGFIYQTRGLKYGRAIVVSTCAAVASIVSGVLAGMLALGERLPSASFTRICLLFGWILIILGVILLVSSTRLLGFLPRSIRRLVKSSNLEKIQKFKKVRKFTIPEELCQPVMSRAPATLHFPTPPESCERMVGIECKHCLLSLMLCRQNSKV